MFDFLDYFRVIGEFLFYAVEHLFAGIVVLAKDGILVTFVPVERAIGVEADGAAQPLSQARLAMTEEGLELFCPLIFGGELIAQEIHSIVGGFMDLGIGLSLHLLINKPICKETEHPVDEISAETEVA